MDSKDDYIKQLSHELKKLSNNLQKLLIYHDLTADRKYLSKILSIITELSRVRGRYFRCLKHGPPKPIIIEPLLQTDSVVISGFCMQSDPCQHIISVDNNQTRMGARVIVKLLEDRDIPVPSHFDYLNQ